MSFAGHAGMRRGHADARGAGCATSATLDSSGHLRSMTNACRGSVEVKHRSDGSCLSVVMRLSASSKDNQHCTVRLVCCTTCAARVSSADHAGISRYPLMQEALAVRPSAVNSSGHLRSMTQACRGNVEVIAHGWATSCSCLSLRSTTSATRFIRYAEPHVRQE